MSRLPGHEMCRACPTCGLGDCPDCDSDGATCPVIHDGDPAPVMTTAAAVRRLTIGRHETS